MVTLNRTSQLDATQAPNVDLGSRSSGGKALTILSLAEYISIMDVCIVLFI
jgi:hypothetical protein